MQYYSVSSFDTKRTLYTFTLREWSIHTQCGFHCVLSCVEMTFFKKMLYHFFVIFWASIQTVLGIFCNQDELIKNDWDTSNAFFISYSNLWFVIFKAFYKMSKNMTICLVLPSNAKLFAFGRGLLDFPWDGSSRETKIDSPHGGIWKLRLFSCSLIHYIYVCLHFFFF